MTTLKNVLTFASVASGGSATLSHLLNVNGIDLKPDVIFLSNNDFTATATTTEITVTNNSSDAATCIVLCESWHDIERQFGTRFNDPFTNPYKSSIVWQCPTPTVPQEALATQPFVVSAGGSSATYAQRPETNANTQLWYKWNEALGATTVINYGVAGSGNLSVTGTTSAFMQGDPFGEGSMYPGIGTHWYGAAAVEPAALTVAFWFTKIAVTGLGWGITKNYNTSTTWGSPFFSVALITTSSNFYEFNIYAGGGARAATSAGVTNMMARRHFIVGTYDGSNVKLYIDGALRATTAYSGSIDYGNHGYWFFGRSPNSIEPFNACYEDVQICSEAKNATWVLNQYLKGR